MLPFLVAPMVAAAAEGAAAAQPPNVLFVVGDDVGYSDFGYFNDHKTITPTIDNLLEEGIFLSVSVQSLTLQNHHINALFHREGALRIRQLVPYTRGVKSYRPSNRPLI